tara:strand:+ start:70 stop:855 length:786 start_codon:yes stop_codon:yes gene_type:complete
MAREPLVTYPDRIVGAKTEINEILDMMLRPQMADLTAEQISAVKDGGPAYMLQVREFAFRTGLVLGNFSRSRLEDFIGCWMHAVIHMYLDKELQGEWKPVAWKVEDHEGYRTFKRPNANQHWNRYAEGTQYGGGTPNPQKTADDKVSEPYVKISVAFCETLQTEPTPSKNGGEKLDKFCKTGLLKHLPRRHREHRERALEMVKEFHGEPQSSAIEEDKIEAARALRASGMKWGNIGKALGVPWQTLRSQMGDIDGDKVTTA